MNVTVHLDIAAFAGSLATFLFTLHYIKARRSGSVGKGPSAGDDDKKTD